VVDAVRCAVDVQRGTASVLQLRTMEHQMAQRA
jgi:hypothetical protein